MRRVTTVLLGVGVAMQLAVGAMAAQMNARIKSVDKTARTITVTEGGQDRTFHVSAQTAFINARGTALARGIESGDLRPGTRVSITFEKTEASQVALRGTGTPAAPAAPKP